MEVSKARIRNGINIESPRSLESARRQLSNERKNGEREKDRVGGREKDRERGHGGWKLRRVNPSRVIPEGVSSFAEDLFWRSFVQPFCILPLSTRPGIHRRRINRFNVPDRR